MVEKSKVKKGKNVGEKMTCPFALFLHLCCFLDLFFVCFSFAFFVFCSGKKQKKQNKSKKTNGKYKINAKNMQIYKSICFPLFVFLYFLVFLPFVYPFILLLCFFDFADLLFVFSICLLVCFFKFVDFFE